MGQIFPGTKGTDETNANHLVMVKALQVGSETLTEAQLLQLNELSGGSTLIDQSDNATNIGAVATPTSGTVACVISRLGKFFTLDFTLTAARMPITDGAGSGSHGALKLFDFVQGSIAYLGARQNYTAFDQSSQVAFTGDTTDTSAVITNVSALTGLKVGAPVSGAGIGAAATIASIDSATQITLSVASTATATGVTITQAGMSGGATGDAVFEIGIGTTVISAAANGTLGATEDDVAADVDVTMAAGTGTGTNTNASSAVTDGTSTAKDINLNWSGTAATVDNSGVLDITGTITVVGVFMGDD